MEGNRVLVFTDLQINAFLPDGAEFPNPQWQVSLHNRIDQLAFYGSRSFAFATGDPFLNDDHAAPTGDVLLYDLNGQNTGVFSLRRKATYLSMAHGHTVVGGDRSFYVLEPSGKPVWNHQTLHDTRAFILLDDTDTVLIAGSTRAGVYRRERVREQGVGVEGD
jgi:hypothetical protein